MKKLLSILLITVTLLTGCAKDSTPQLAPYDALPKYSEDFQTLIDYAEVNTAVIKKFMGYSIAAYNTMEAEAFCSYIGKQSFLDDMSSIADKCADTVNAIQVTDSDAAMLKVKMTGIVTQLNATNLLFAQANTEYSEAMAGEAGKTIENAKSRLEYALDKYCNLFYGCDIYPYLNLGENTEIDSSTRTCEGLIAAGYNCTLAVKADGTVLATGENGFAAKKVADWKDIVAVSVDGCKVGLKLDGTVVADGNNYHNECNVEDWTDIIDIDAGGYHTVGLRVDGLVLVAGENVHNESDVSKWRNIIDVSAGDLLTVGLKADGTVVATGRTEDGQCNVGDWTDIIDIDAGDYHTVGLKADGTVVAVGKNSDGQCNVSEWTNVVAISASPRHTVGLKADGTVVAIGWNDNGQCNVENWTDIIAISAGSAYTIGLKADGTLVVAGTGRWGECDVSSWTDIKTG